MRVLVTGASGFVGARLVQRLADGGHNVTGTCLLGEVKHPKVEQARADFTDPDFTLPERDFDTVVHLAALTPLERDAGRLERVNYAGALNLFERIKDRTGMFVYVSGLGVFGDTGGSIITEQTPIRPHTRFAEIRVRAQAELDRRCHKSSIGFCTAYLGDVYGSSGWFSKRIIERIRNGRFRVPGGGRYIKSLVHVADAASALAAVVEKSPRGESYIIADSEPCPFRDLINYCADKLGKKHPGSVPVFLARVALGRDACTLLTTTTAASNAKIARLAEFKYPSYREGLDQVFSEA